jgi:hypothetical protein
MQNVSMEKDIEELDYSTKDAQILLQEFVVLLHEVSTNYENAINRLQNDHRREIDELKTLLKYYESNDNTSVKVFKIRKYILDKIKWYAKRVTKFTFRVAKKVADNLGLKEYIKKSRLYKRLYRSGIIDKLTGRV